jgi:hypothetical protein
VNLACHSYWKHWGGLSLVPQDYMAEEAVSLSCFISSYTCSIWLCMVIGHWFALHVLPMYGMLWGFYQEGEFICMWDNVIILLTHHCTMVWSSNQVVCTSIEFTDKSYNRYVVSVQSGEFWSIQIVSIHYKQQNLIKYNKHSEAKQASLNQRLAVTMPTTFVLSYTDMHRIP